jgi:hypothetical protein
MPKQIKAIQHNQANKYGDATQRIAFLFGYTYPEKVQGEGLREIVKGEE